MTNYFYIMEDFIYLVYISFLGFVLIPDEPPIYYILLKIYIKKGNPSVMRI